MHRRVDRRSCDTLSPSCVPSKSVSVRAVRMTLDRLLSPIEQSARSRSVVESGWIVVARLARVGSEPWSCSHAEQRRQARALALVATAGERIE